MLEAVLLVVIAASAAAPDESFDESLDESFDEVFDSLVESLEQAAERHRAEFESSVKKPAARYRAELESGINKPAGRSIVEIGQRSEDFNLSLIDSWLIGIGTGSNWVKPSFADYARSCLLRESVAGIPMTDNRWEVQGKNAVFVFRFRKEEIIAKIVFVPAENLTCFPRRFTVHVFGKRSEWQEVARGEYRAGVAAYQQLLVDGKEKVTGSRIDVRENLGDPDHVCLPEVRFLAPL
jgi:hypothetical protein